MTDDPRVAHLNAVAAKMAADHRYDPHFAGFAERIGMETLLFLARYDAVRHLSTPRVGPGSPTDPAHIARLLGSGYTQVDWTSQPRWRHKKRGTVYVELGRGELQRSYPDHLIEGVRLVAYRGEDGRVWFRPETEFDDGRFERVP